MHLVIIAGGYGEMAEKYPNIPKLLLRLNTGDTVLDNLLSQIGQVLFHASDIWRRK